MKKYEISIDRIQYEPNASILLLAERLALKARYLTSSSSAMRKTSLSR